MRIIAGKAKGRKLRAVAGSMVRPTSDRVKESLFNILAPHLSGMRVLDLFAGTGNLGLESLSRDAAFCHFVDQSGKSLQCVRENLRDLGFEAQAHCSKGNALSFLKKYRGEPFQLLFMDPPYGDAKAWGDLLRAAASSSVISPAGWLVAEHPGNLELPDIEGWTRLDRRDYGTTSITRLGYQPVHLMNPELPKEEP